MERSLRFITRKVSLIGGDFIFLYLSFYFALLAFDGYQTSNLLIKNHYLAFVFLFSVWLTIFYIEGLYEARQVKGRMQILVQLLRALLVGGIIGSLWFYLTGEENALQVNPQTLLITTVIISFFSIYSWRLFYLKLIRSGKLTTNLIIVGYNSIVKEIVVELQRKLELGFQVKGIVLDKKEEALPDRLQHLAIYTNYSDLKEICNNRKINNIILALPPKENTMLLNSLFECHTAKVNSISITDFYEKTIGKIPVNIIEYSWFLENVSEKTNFIREFVKRLFDISFSLFVLMVSLPLTVFIAILLKFYDKGTVFFIQTRTGLKGKNFSMIKFRTMHPNAEINGPQWATKNDPRITKLGRFLRKTRIDELPQIVNVLKGEMSVVGPRPERPEFIKQLENQIPFYRERLIIKPGLTGWAQVMGPVYGGSVQESLEKLQYDLFYIKNQSLALDLSILLKTVKAVACARGM